MRDLITLMENPTVNKMAEKADLLVSDKKHRALLPSRNHCHRDHAMPLSDDSCQFSDTHQSCPCDIRQMVTDITQKLNTIVSLTPSVQSFSADT